MEFHKWKAGKWAILFSHPADFMPVCTTLHEIGRLALCLLHARVRRARRDGLPRRPLSVDPVKSHTEWLTDVGRALREQDRDQVPGSSATTTARSRPPTACSTRRTRWTRPCRSTIRCVFIINPENKLMLSLNYPACVGRSMDEIVRCVKALQLSYGSIATPANWPNNHSDMLVGGKRTSVFPRAVFLLPTVSPEEAKSNYPGPPRARPPEKPYPRLVKAEDVGRLHAAAQRSPAAQRPPSMRVVRGARMWDPRAVRSCACILVLMPCQPEAHWCRGRRVQEVPQQPLKEAVLSEISGWNCCRWALRPHPRPHLDRARERESSMLRRARSASGASFALPRRCWSSMFARREIAPPCGAPGPPRCARRPSPAP